MFIINIFCLEFREHKLDLKNLAKPSFNKKIQLPHFEGILCYYETQTPYSSWGTIHFSFLLPFTQPSPSNS